MQQLLHRKWRRRLVDKMLTNFVRHRQFTDNSSNSGNPLFHWFRINAKTQLLKLYNWEPKARWCHYPRPTRQRRGRLAVASNKRSPGRGDYVKYCIGEHHTLAPTRGSHCVFSFAPPSADASDGDSNTTEPSALRVCILKMFLFVSIFNISTGFCSWPRFAADPILW